MELVLNFIWISFKMLIFWHKDLWVSLHFRAQFGYTIENRFLSKIIDPYIIMAYLPLPSILTWTKSSGIPYMFLERRYFKKYICPFFFLLYWSQCEYYYCYYSDFICFTMSHSLINMVSIGLSPCQLVFYQIFNHKLVYLNVHISFFSIVSKFSHSHTLS